MSCCSGGTGQTENYVEYKTGETVTVIADFGNWLDSRTLTGTPSLGFLAPATGTAGTASIITEEFAYKGRTVPANTCVSFDLTALSGVNAGEEAILPVTCELSDGDELILDVRVLRVR